MAANVASPFGTQDILARFEILVDRQKPPKDSFNAPIVLWCQEDGGLVAATGIVTNPKSSKRRRHSSNSDRPVPRLRTRPTVTYLRSTSEFSMQVIKLVRIRALKYYGIRVISFRCVGSRLVIGPATLDPGALTIGRGSGIL
jgi:hypothetical protein